MIDLTSFEKTYLKVTIMNVARQRLQFCSLINVDAVDRGPNASTLINYLPAKRYGFLEKISATSIYLQTRTGFCGIREMSCSICLRFCSFRIITLTRSWE